MLPLLISLTLALTLLVIFLAVLARRFYVALYQERIGRQELAVQLRRVEADMLRLQTVRRDFVANISHELRTPLASIKLLVETLEGGALDDETVAAEFTRKIGQETEHLIGMTQELLDLARLEAAPAMQPRRIETTQMIDEALGRMHELAADKKVQLCSELPLILPAVWADEAQVGRVFVNLLHNAIKFTPAGGVVAIEARPEPGFVAFSISDTGPGIPPGEEVRIFERFYKADASRQRGGTGLGLSIARHIVEAQGGQIWALNRDEAGAVFTFTLPVAL